MGLSTADCITFCELCQLFDEMSMTNDKKSKEQLFKSFVRNWFQQEKEIFTIYPVLRLLDLSNNIEDHLVFEYCHLTKIITNDLEVDFNISTETSKLSILEKVAPIENKYSERFEPSNISIAFLNEYIDQFLQNKDSKKSIAEILEKMNSLERKWFLLILLSEVENVTNMEFDSYIWCINPSLGQLLIDGYQLKDLLSEYHPKTFSEKYIREKFKFICIGKPFFAMKLNDIDCTRCDFLRIQEFCKGKLLAECCYEGEWVVMHRYNNGKDYKFFSKDMDDFTKFYVSSNYDFSKEIEPLFKDNVKDVILEGQMLVQSCSTGTLIGKFDVSPDGSFYDSRFMNASNKDTKICFIVSDILYLNSESLSNTQYEKRYRILNEDIFNEINGKTVIISKPKEIRIYEDFFNCLENAITCMQQGFILRDSVSLYVPETVPESHCVFNVKPNYNKFVTLYLSIVGVEYSENKPSSIKFFLLAARDSSSTLTICLKVRAPSKSVLYYKIIGFLGISSNHHIELPPWLKSNLEISSFNRYVSKDNILIVEVKWAKINPGSDELSYISSIRNDLSIKSINLFTDVEYFEKRFNEGIKNVEVIPHALNSLYRANDNVKRSLKEIDDLGFGKCFDQSIVCVLNCPKDFDIRKIRQFIHFLGGSIVAHPTKDTCYIIATDPENAKTAAALNMKNIPILKASWVIRCINEKRLQQIDLENDVLLLDGSNQLSIQDLNYSIEEQDIPGNLLNDIFL